MEHSNNYARIDLDILKENMRIIKQQAKTAVLLVVKADAYGHGAVRVAKHLRGDYAFLGVSSISEALELRNAGLDKPIIILGHTPVSAYHQCIRQGIRPAIFRYEDALELSRQAQKLQMRAPFHFAVDTGMSRIGFQATEEDADICGKIAALPGLEPEGLFSHFSCADHEDQSRTMEQKALFDSFCRMLEARGVHVKLRHVENSAAFVNFNTHYDMVRVGIVVYGMPPSHEVNMEKLPVKPVLSWHSHVTHVKPLEPGRVVSYGAKYTVDRPTVAATVPVGYADGYRRALYQNFYVLIRGQKAKILGVVCMDQMVVDVTDIPGVCPGDPVVLIGQDGDQVITADEMADALDTINYEITSALTHRVPRCYTQNGEITQTVNYLL